MRYPKRWRYQDNAHWWRYCDQTYVCRKESVTEVEREQDRIIKVVEKYPQGHIWADLLLTYGSILDNMAKICYKRLLPMIGDGVKEVETSDPIPKEVEGTYCHIVLASSFSEFLMLTGILQYSFSKIHQGFSRIRIPSAAQVERPIFDYFCKVNKVPEHLIEPGWKEYLED